MVHLNEQLAIMVNIEMHESYLILAYINWQRILVKTESQSISRVWGVVWYMAMRLGRWKLDITGIGIVVWMCRFTLKERKCRTRRNVGIGTIGFGDRNLDRLFGIVEPMGDKWLDWMLSNNESRQNYSCLYTACLKKCPTFGLV